jgi:hypothetical protein
MKHDLAPLDAADAEGALVLALRSLAQALPERDAFTLAWRGVAVTVAYTRGSAASLSVRAHYPTVPTGTVLTGHLRAVRPMAIELRPERGDDRAAKRTGVSVEAQTGDAEFDATVYVDTPSPPDVARRVLAARALRAAALEVLAVGVSELVLDDDARCVHVRLATPAHFAAWGLEPERLLDRVVDLAKHAPPVEALYGSHHSAAPPVSTGALMAVFAASAPVAIGSYLSLLPGVCRGPCMAGGCELLVLNDPLCWRPHAIGLALGLAGWVVALLTLGRRLRGRSDSHRARVTFAAASLCAALAAGEALGVIAAWWRP